MRGGKAVTPGPGRVSGPGREVSQDREDSQGREVSAGRRSALNKEKNTLEIQTEINANLMGDVKESPIAPLLIL